MANKANKTVGKLYKELHGIQTAAPGYGSVPLEINPHADFNEYFRQIIDSMYDWVRVLDRNNRIIFMNQAMINGVGKDGTGMKCYELLGKPKPCENCISAEAALTGVSHEKEECIGDRIYSVRSSPIHNSNGEVVAVVEVLRDITEEKKAKALIVKQNEKLKKDLILAKKLQCSLLPRELPSDILDIAYIYRPCEDLGGDFFDVFRIDRDNVGLYIADVSGHGVAASMLTVFLRSSFNRRELSPSKVLLDLFKKFNEAGFDGELYITLFYLVINVREKTLTYANAGHHALPIICHMLPQPEISFLYSRGVPISNWVKRPEYENTTIAFDEHSKLMLYTDGLVEIRNGQKELFGDNRLLQFVLNELKHNSSEETLNRLLKAVCDFAGISDASQIPDDITAAVISLKKQE